MVKRRIVEQKTKSRFRMPTVKRMILKWVNDDSDPEELVMRKDVLGVPQDMLESAFFYVRKMKESVRRAFEVPDPYDRDWLLFTARYYNAMKHAVPARLDSIPGVVPMVKDTIEDRVLAFAQAHLANRMAVCERRKCGRYYFKKYKPQVAKTQKFCSGACRRLSKNELNWKWYNAKQGELFKQQLERSGMPQEKIDKLLNGESMRFGD